SFACEPEGRLASGVSIVEAFTKLRAEGVQVTGVNCMNGPHATVQLLQRIPIEGLLAAYPNAGYPRYAEGRFIYHAAPDYFARAAQDARFGKILPRSARACSSGLRRDHTGRQLTGYPACQQSRCRRNVKGTIRYHSAATLELSRPQCARFTKRTPRDGGARHAPCAPTHWRSGSGGRSSRRV